LIIVFAIIINSLANFAAGLNPDPISYLPVFNPIDLIQLFALWTLLKWYSLQGHELALKSKIDPLWAIGLLASFVFIWFNVVLLKAIHLINQYFYRLDSNWLSRDDASIE
jgi:hypothetical protein